MSKIEQFGKYQVALGTDGLPIELWRTADEVACLCFDTEARHLVEVRVLTGGECMNDAQRLSFRQRVRAAMELRGECLTRVTGDGVEDGIPYYATEFTDGEPIDQYIGRRGSMYASLALGLAVQLVDALIELQSYPRLLLNVNLGNVMVVLWEDAYLRLRVRDYGLAREEPDLADNRDPQELIGEVARLLFSLIVGRPYEEGDEKTLDTISNLPSNLKYLLRQVLTHSSRAPVSLEGLRREFKSGLGAVSDGIGSRGDYEKQPVKAPLCPRFCLYEALLKEADIERIIGAQYQIEDGPQRAVMPYAERVRDLERERVLNLQILPPNRVVSQEFYTPVQLRMWKSDPKRHEHLLRTLSIWETGEFTFIAEESPVGFALSRLLVARGRLEPVEAFLILLEVGRGIEEADDCGIEIRNLHPANVVIGFQEGTTNRQCDEYLEKRVDVWHEFSAKLRTHFTMRSLVEPPLSAGVGLGGDSPEEAYRAALSRAFVALTSLMVSGSALRPASTGTLSPQLGEYLEDSLERTEHEAGGISIPDFLDGLRAIVGGKLPAEKKSYRKRVAAKPAYEADPDSRAVGKAGVLSGLKGAPDVDVKPLSRNGKEPFLVSRSENPEEFERRQKQLTRSIRLLNVRSEGEASRNRWRIGLIAAGIALALGLGIYGLTRIGGGEKGGTELAEGEPHEEVATPIPGGKSTEREPENIAQGANPEEMPVIARPRPPEVIRPAIVPGSDDAPTELYDD